jgi:hypothetical protein|tara:strand:- start:185 stop:367 length:183 start_codon:yes stop_codon:yes gene_type:complete
MLIFCRKIDPYMLYLFGDNNHKVPLNYNWLQPVLEKILHSCSTQEEGEEDKDKITSKRHI